MWFVFMHRQPKNLFFFEKLPKAIGKRYKTTKIIAKSDSSFKYFKDY